MAKKDLFKEMSSFASSTVEVLKNMKNDVSEMINEQIKSSLKKMDFVTKAEFNVLKKNIEELQKKLANKEDSKKRATKPKTKE
jgi:BMFP domain-containing protein YqiC